MKANEKKQYVLDHHTEQTTLEMAEALGVSYGAVRWYVNTLHLTDKVKQERPRVNVPRWNTVPEGYFDYNLKSGDTWLI